MKRILGIFLFLISVQTLLSQSIVDSCLTSVSAGTSFGSGADVANTTDADMLQWTGSAWVGGWSNANLTIPPPTNTPGCRAVFMGNAVTWTTGGEGFGVRLTTPLVAGQTYSFTITYVSHGFGSTGSFSPAVYTNSFPSLGYLVGNLPPVGYSWTTNTYTFTATAAQNGHNWFMLSTSPNGTSGLVNSFCKTCNVAAPCSVNLGSDTALCTGQTLTLNATTSGATYQWQDNSTNPTYTVTASGTYWVNVTAGGCMATDTIHITYNSPPTINLGNDTTLCPAQNLVLNATTSNATYQWQNNSTNATFTVTQQGTYWVNVFVNSCKATDTIHVAYDQIQVPQLGPDTSLCIGQSLVLNANSSGVTYQWQDNSTSATYTVSQSGMYWVHVSDTACNAGDTINVIFNSPPNINLGNDTALCPQQKVVLNAAIAGATYQWYNSNNSTYTLTAQGTYTVNQPGTYTVTVTVNGCSSADSIHVTYYSMPVPSLGPDTSLCQGQTLVLNATASGVIYQWQDNSTSATYAVTQAGTYWVHYSNGTCISGDTIHVNYNSPPIVNLGNDTTLCQGDQVVLNAAIVNATYQWQNNSTASTYTVTQAGTFWVNVTANNCSASDTINILYKPRPDPNIGHDTSLCVGDKLILNAAAANATYHWQDNSTMNTFTVSQQGVYSVSVTVNGCTGTDTISILFNPVPDPYLGADTLACEETFGGFVLNPGIVGATYLWQDNSTASTYAVTQQGLYWVIVTQNNCSGEDSLRVTVKECTIVMEMPNVFSPNKDGVNEYFLPSKMKGIERMTMFIYNRWGQKLFESDGAGWDGKYSGADCTEGTYFWMVDYTTNKGVSQSLKGYLTLVR